ncbi:family 16 glycoside hydrolase [Thermophagus sp. OGC60D27]|uniref:family 16 glycoside hydrolase n=1 Tax=Thermophagus sp. OGC60D27 TaxID=3458415 RepID=UPI004037C45B
MKHLFVTFLLFCLFSNLFSQNKLLLDDDLIQYFTFENIRDNKVIDKSSLKADGDMTKVAVVDGQKGKSAEFNNKDAFINSGISPAVNHHSAMVWIKPYSYGPEGSVSNKLVFEKTGSYYMNILSKTEGNKTRGKIRIGGHFESENGSKSKWEYLDSPDEISLNKWTHVAYTFDGDKLRLYINGRLAAKKKTLPVLKPNTRDMVWGALYKNGAYHGHFHGCLDDCMVFSRKLESAEIHSYYLESAFDPQLPEGMTRIFNGVDLSGWTKKGNKKASYDIIDGMLRPRQPVGGDGAGWIQYNQKVTDFIMYCEWKATTEGDFENQAANNGIQFHLTENSTNPVWDAIEIQIADDDNYSLWYNKDGYEIGDKRELSGAIYGIVGINKNVYNGTNNWNSFLLSSIGDSIKLYYNTELVLNISRKDFPDSFKMWGKTQTSLSARPGCGYVALQSHRGADVYIRNVAIKDMGGEPQSVVQPIKPSEIKITPDIIDAEFKVSHDNT